ncbi:PGG domain - like 2 [Theobroma cacao]|nr:PGG domain - like 2 [Theobroma cacao]
MVGTTFRDWCRYFQYKEGAKKEDKEKNRADARNVLLVVATLIAAVTFQAGVNLPWWCMAGNQGGQYSRHCYHLSMHLRQQPTTVASVSMIISYGYARDHCCYSGCRNVSVRLDCCAFNNAVLDPAVG